MQPVPFAGVSSQVAQQLLKTGQGNNISLTPSRTYWQILQQNLFTFINIVFFALGMVLISLGSYSDAFLVVVVILGSVVVSVCQELWAKHKLDQIAILTRPKVNAWRDQTWVEIDPSEIVLGDLLEVKAGDQVVVDGQILSETGVDLDESLLTGESEVVHRQQGDQIFSGSICVSGQAYYRVEKVGRDNLAFQITQGARTFRQVYTPLQQEINLLIRIFLLVSTFLWILVGVAVFANIVSLSEGIQRAAVIAGLVPAGLYLAITLAYALGAVRMLGQKVLVQQANAVESVSNVEILCLDKTGTLTANHLVLEQVYPLTELAETTIRKILGDYVASCSQQNPTSEAIAQVCPGCKLQLSAEVPFNSSRKWSGITLAPDLSKSYVLGAPEVIYPIEQLPQPVQVYFTSQVKQGKRVLLLAIAPSPLYNLDQQACLPSDLKPIAFLTFKDQLRPAAQETLASFAQAGITLKIISGDNPQTVLALAKQVGMHHHQPLKLISGNQLQKLDPVQFEQAVLETNIFGRITPEQKSRIIQTLRQSGKYIAMIGDGVNDVLSLKQANLGIAMESGSKATRNAADIVLLQDSFASLPQAFLEGQRIRNGIQDVIKLFMVRVICFTLLIFATSLVGNTFPFLNKHSAAITLISVGLPSTFLPIFARSGVIPHRSMIRSLLHFDLAAILTLSLVALGVYLKYLIPVINGRIILTDQDLLVPRSAIATILIYCGLLLVPFLKPPTRAWVGAEPLSGDWRYTIMAFSLIGFYMVALLIPPLRNFFDIAWLSWQDYGSLALVATIWAVGLRTLWRSRFLDKFLGVSLKPPTN